MPSKRLVLALALAVVACKSEPETPPPPAKPDLGPEAAAINAELPEAMKGKLEFVAKELDDGDVFALVPKDWAQSEFIPDMFEPANVDKFGPKVSVWTGTNCDGTCSPKDWKAVADKVEFGSYNDAPFTKERDEAIGDNGRLVVYVGGDEVHIRAAWWKPDASRYLNCRVDLDATWAPAKDAFVRACLATKLRDWL